MRYKLYPLLTVIVFSFIITLAIFGNLLSGKTRDKKNPGKDDVLSLENSIIVNSNIRIATGFPVHEEDEDEIPEGNIIYDKSFDDIIIKYESKKDKKNKKTADSETAKTPAKSDAVAFINQLRKKDNKWHLTVHKIKKGDFIWLIARRYKTDYKYILQVNNITDPKMLTIGKTLLIPNKNGITYKVGKKDSLNSIAKKYGVSANNISCVNNFKKGKLPVGKTIFIPDGHHIAVASTTSKKKGSKARVAKSKRIFLWPLRGKITSSFGRRRDPLTKSRRFHTGLDIGVPIGTPIKAAGEGKVIFSGWKDGYGNVIIIEHKNNFITVYAHNKRNLVKEEDTVQAGQEIAQSGMTGSVTGAHLHFEVRKNMTPLNPLRFLK